MSDRLVPDVRRAERELRQAMKDFLADRGAKVQDHRGDYRLLLDPVPDDFVTRLEEWAPQDVRTDQELVPSRNGKSGNADLHPPTCRPYSAKNRAVPYLRATLGPHPTGVLLYASDGETRRLHYRIQGHPILVRSLDLNRDWSEIHEELLGLARELEGRGGNASGAKSGVVDHACPEGLRARAIIGCATTR